MTILQVLLGNVHQTKQRDTNTLANKNTNTDANAKRQSKAKMRRICKKVKREKEARKEYNYYKGVESTRNNSIKYGRGRDTKSSQFKRAETKIQGRIQTRVTMEMRNERLRKSIWSDM